MKKTAEKHRLHSWITVARRVSGVTHLKLDVLHRRPALKYVLQRSVNPWYNFLWEQKPATNTSSSFLSAVTLRSFSRTRSGPPQVGTAAVAPPLLSGRSVFAPLIRGARCAAVRGGRTLCSARWSTTLRFRTGEGRARGSARGGCDDRWDKFSSFQNFSLLPAALLLKSFCGFFIRLFLFCFVLFVWPITILFCKQVEDWRVNLRCK